MLCFYKSVIHSVIEHASLVCYKSNKLNMESIQKHNLSKLITHNYSGQLSHSIFQAR